MSDSTCDASNSARVDLDVSPIGPWRSNYDYREGLYFGSMGRYKSVDDFLKQKRKKKKKRQQRKKLLAQLLTEMKSNG